MLDWQTKPSLFLLTYEKDGEWVAIGSRKWLDIRFEANYDEYEYQLLGDWSRTLSPAFKHININGQLIGMIAVTANTQLAAIGALIDAIRKEEDEERAIEAKKAQRQADIARFGGEVNEELIRKVVRWRKKQAKKAAQEREYDYDEWDEY